MGDQFVAETCTSQHTRQTSMPPVEFEPTISAGERLQTYALDRAATGTGLGHLYCYILSYIVNTIKFLHIAVHYVPSSSGSIQIEGTIIIIGISNKGI
jgi:hypothetical protein